MAYVPGLDHDLFVSYAHEDLPWVSALQEQLTERLLHRLGWECDVWQDKNKLRTGQNFPSELEKAIRRSAAFLAVLSRNYQGKDWCEKELDAFRREAEKDDGMETGGYGRVLKVIKFPWLNDAHEDFFGEYQHVEFFDRDAATGKEREFKHTSERFRNAADMLSFHIEKLFEAMLRGKEKVFVARGADDDAAEREATILEIRAAGNALSPPPLGAIPKGLNDKGIRQYIGEARTTVHLLGAAHDPAIRRQIDLARECGKRLIFCLLKGHESAAGEQKKLIEDIRENKLDFPEGTWKLLKSRSSAALRQDLIGLLAPQRPTGASEDKTSRVYLLCDPTTPEDAGFARKVQSVIQEHERISVELPRLAADSISPRDHHERLLGECNGLLLYHEKAPPKWVKRNFEDLLRAEDIPRQRELMSKALLVSGADFAFPGLTVIQRRDPFELNQLEPFIAPLRAPLHAHALASNLEGDAANAV